MKKHTYLLFILSLLFFTTISSFGQSLVITPQQTVSENTDGDNIKIRSNSDVLGLQTYRYNGTSASKLPVFSGDYLLRIGAGGYYSSENSFLERVGMFFYADQNWNGTSAGTRIFFRTTSNNTIIPIERLTIASNGNIGIGNWAPTSKLHITSSSIGDPYPPEIHLQATAIAEELGTKVYIKTSSTNAQGGWTNEIKNHVNPVGGEVRWIHSPTGNTPLILAGSGDAFIERNASVGGYTKLGGYDAPAIKMKKLTLTTSGASGGIAAIAHELAQSKILSVSVLVNGAAGNDIPPSYSSDLYSGYLYFFYVTSSSIIVENSAGNHSYIAARPARILITYEE